MGFSATRLPFFVHLTGCFHSLKTQMQWSTLDDTTRRHKVINSLEHASIRYKLRYSRTQGESVCSGVGTPSRAFGASELTFQRKEWTTATIQQTHTLRFTRGFLVLLIDSEIAPRM